VAAAEGTAGANRKAPQLHVPVVESRLQFRLSREATGLSIARTASDLEKRIVAVAEGVAIVVNGESHHRQGRRLGAAD
jgi:hypothetical protein